MAIFYLNNIVWYKYIVPWLAKKGMGSGFMWWIVPPDLDVYVEDLKDVDNGLSRERIKDKTLKYWLWFTVLTY